MRATLVIAGKKFKPHAAIKGRKDVRYPVMIGMNVARKSSVKVDPGMASGHER